MKSTVTFALCCCLAAAAVAAPRTVIVQPGESLSVIAARELGDGNHYPVIAALNGIEPPYTVAAGRRLLLPDTGTPAVVATPATAAVPAPLTTPPRTDTLAAAIAREFVLEPAGEPLTLTAALRYGLQQNLALRRAQLSPRTAATGVETARAAFDPQLTSSLGSDWSRSQTETTPGNYSSRRDSRSSDYSVGLAQTLTTGTELSVDLSGGRNSSSPRGSAPDPSNNAAVSVALTQPLLEGNGRDIVTADVTGAEWALAAATLTAERNAQTTAADIAARYWALAQAEAGERIARRSLAVAEAVLGHNRHKYELGLLARLEVLTAQSGVASRREALVNACTARQNAAEQLAFLVWGEHAAARAQFPAAVTTPPAVAVPPAIDVLEARALTVRPDLAAARRDLDAAALDLKVRANALLPSLDLTGAAGTGGTAGQQSDAWDNLASNRQPDWRVGLTLSIPLGNRADRARHEAAVIALESEQLSLTAAENEVRLAVRNARRAVMQGRERLTAARTAEDLAHERLQGELDALTLGLGDTVRVLDAEQAAAAAEQATAQARCSLAAAQADLASVLGEYPAALTE